MPLTPDRSICLRKVEYSETSQILTLFTQSHGRLSVIAKGAHRTTKQGASRFSGGIDLLDIGQALFTLDPARQLNTLAEWTLLEGNLAMRTDLRALYLAQYAAELVSHLIEEHDAHPNLFTRLEQTLTDLATPKREESFLSFELDLLKETGYLPELTTCVACGFANQNRDQIYFSPTRGGIICSNCEGASPDRAQFDPRLLRMIQSIQKLPRQNGQAHRLPRLTRHQTDPINHLLADHIEHTLQKRLRLPAYVLESTK